MNSVKNEVFSIGEELQIYQKLRSMISTYVHGVKGKGCLTACQGERGKNWDKIFSELLEKVALSISGVNWGQILARGKSKTEGRHVNIDNI